MNKCKNLRIKTKKYIKYLYCIELKKEINFNNCYNCEHKIYKKPKPIKQRTYKQAKLERNRKSAFTDDLTTCIECGKYKEHLHEIFRGRNRLKSIAYSFVIPLCSTCHSEIHNSTIISEKWHIMGQKEFEKNNTREEFIKLFGRNYIK